MTAKDASAKALGGKAHATVALALGEAFDVSTGSQGRVVAVVSLVKRFGPDRGGYVVVESSDLRGADLAAAVAFVAAIV